MKNKRRNSVGSNEKITPFGVILSNYDDHHHSISIFFMKLLWRFSNEFVSYHITHCIERFICPNFKLFPLFHFVFVFCFVGFNSNRFVIPIHSFFLLIDKIFVLGNHASRQKTHKNKIQKPGYTFFREKTTQNSHFVLVKLFFVYW